MKYRAVKSRTATAIIFGITLVALATVACTSAGATPQPVSPATATAVPTEAAPTAPTPPPDTDETAPAGPTTIEVDAPIEGVEVVILEIDPPQYLLQIVSGLPGGCAQFNGYESSIEGTTITVTVTNLVPAAPVPCTAIYGYHEGNINLGSDFAAGETYSVVVNGEAAATFTAQ